jgi:putative glutamine amidotransferase
MSRPAIGITTSVSVEQYPERAYVNAAYIRAVQGAGGIPILLPPQLSEEVGRELFRRIDGLLLTGGGDLDPGRFGEVAHATVSEVSVARDDLELALVEAALSTETPLFAICRGIQVLNVALGGTLWQDVPSDVGTSVTHSQKERRDRATHDVTVSGETRLAEALGAHELAVNSFHHQAIRKLGRGLRDVAWAPDGVIEGVELAETPTLVLGVQWHPEELVEHDRAAANLFRALVDAATRRAR